MGTSAARLGNSQSLARSDGYEMENHQLFWEDIPPTGPQPAVPPSASPPNGDVWWPEPPQPRHRPLSTYQNRREFLATAFPPRLDEGISNRHAMSRTQQLPFSQGTYGTL